MKKLIAFILVVTTVFTISCGVGNPGNENSAVSSSPDISEVSEISENASEEESTNVEQSETVSLVSEEPSEESSYEQSEEVSREFSDEPLEEASEEPSEEPSVPHVHTESVVKGKAATCTNDGLTDGAVCSVCGEALVKQTVIKSKGHTESVVKGKTATCTSDGLTDGAVCSVCGEVLVKQTVIKATGIHAYENGACVNCGAFDPDGELDHQLLDRFPVENRAVWYRAVEKSDAEVNNTVKLMSDMGINTIYIEAWYHGHVIGYSENELVTHYSKAHGDYDALEGFCRIAHSYGIEVHAWVENFYIGPKGNNSPNPELIEATEGHHLIDSQGRDFGPTVFGDLVFLNAFDPFCQDLVLNVYTEMIEKYDIDGLHLDYIRFPDPNPYDFGYNDDIITAFQSEYNTTEDPHSFSVNSDMWKKWCLFRESIITSWVEKVYKAAKAIDSSVSISCAVMNNYPDCRTPIFQNFASWVENGTMDEVIIMSYCSDLSTPKNNINTFMKYTADKCFLSVGLSAFEASPADILVSQIGLSRSNAYGSSLFAWGNLIVHRNNYFDAIKEDTWAGKAVRADRGSQTAEAYCEWLLEVLKIKSHTSPLSGSFYTDAAKKAQALLSDAKGTDFLALSSERRQEYLNKAVLDFGELKALIEACADKEARDFLLSGVEYIICCMKLTHA